MDRLHEQLKTTRTNAPEFALPPPPPEGSPEEAAWIDNYDEKWNAWDRENMDLLRLAGPVGAYKVIHELITQRVFQCNSLAPLLIKDSDKMWAKMVAAYGTKALENI